jgi:ABC-type nitrate/sulfonate/bicarbonate transport system ATPase subunit
VTARRDGIAVIDLSLSIHQGKVTALACVPPTSTLVIDLLAGAGEPESGYVVRSGRSARVSRGHDLLAWRSLEGNVEAGLAAQGRIRGGAKRDAARRALSLVGLERIASRRPHQVGQSARVRCELARGLALEPDVLLLDDPFCSLDGVARAVLSEVLEHVLGATDLAALLATSDARTAARLGDAVVVISGSRGSPLGGFAPRPRSDDDTNSLGAEVSLRLAEVVS